nr:divalent metal cation transporter [Saprospiraceae bacterium]
MIKPRNGISIRKTLGPGLLLAGAAIGVSHLVQATRAGADYGFDLWWILVFACVTKYPFLEFGPRFTAATGDNLIAGYWKLGKFPYCAFVFITVGTMFIVQAAVTIVTAGLAEQLFKLGWNHFTWSVVILGSCVFLLMVGRYRGLDLTMKIIISVLSLGTLVAVLLALGTGAAGDVAKITPPSYWNTAGLAFIIAFIGWMPIPIDSAVWHSIWMKEKSRQNDHRASMREALFDFNSGYFIAAGLGLLFFLLGALIMFGTETSFSSNSVTFSSQLVELYGKTLGVWSESIVSIAAFTAMVSTTLAVTDAYPRVFSNLHDVRKNKNWPQSYAKKRIYNLSLLSIPVISLSILFFLTGSFTLLIDFAAGLSFLSAPILAWFNYKLVTGPQMPDADKPNKHYRVFSFLCFVCLALFALLYLLFRLGLF